MSEQLAELGQQRLLAAPADDQLDASAAAWRRELSRGSTSTSRSSGGLSAATASSGSKADLPPFLRFARALGFDTPQSTNAPPSLPRTRGGMCAKRAICCLDASAVRASRRGEAHLWDGAKLSQRAKTWHMSVRFASAAAADSTTSQARMIIGASQVAKPLWPSATRRCSQPAASTPSVFSPAKPRRAVSFATHTECDGGQRE